VLAEYAVDRNLNLTLGLQLIDLISLRQSRVKQIRDIAYFLICAGEPLRRGISSATALKEPAPARDERDPPAIN
jgi:hypothetical protein